MEFQVKKNLHAHVSNKPTEKSAFFLESIMDEKRKKKKFLLKNSNPFTYFYSHISPRCYVVTMTALEKGFPAAPVTVIGVVLLQTSGFA